MIVENFQDSMNATEVITHNQRSESAKKMWEKRRAKKEEKDMSSAPPMKTWIFHAEWLTLMATVVGLFLFVHHESVHTNERLDYHMTESAKRHDELITSLNRRVDESTNAINRRCDELHKEFYELLKEMRK